MIVVDSPEKMAQVNAADKLFCRFRMEGCPYCVDTQADWDQMSAAAERSLVPGAVIAEIEAKMVPMFRATMPNGAAYSVNQFPTISIFRKGVFRGEKDARKKKELLKVLQNLGFMKKAPTGRKRKTGRKARTKRR
jgi:hypothetical protein